MGTFYVLQALTKYDTIGIDKLSTLGGLQI